VVLGHAHAKVSEIYAKKNMDLAAKVAGEMGEEKESQELPCARRLLVGAIEHTSTDVHCGRSDRRAQAFGEIAADWPMR
jgi:hypothetical protein